MSNTFLHRSAVATIVALASILGTAVALLAWTAPTALAAWSTLRRPSSTPDRLVEHTVVLICAGGFGALVVWGAVSVLVCTFDALRDTAGPASGGLLRPRIVTVLVAGAVGTLVTAGAASATGTAAERGPEPPAVSAGLPLPDRAFGGVRLHRVRPGESLWSITAELLPGCADAESVARRWPRLHHLNRQRIGGDPDVIHPGTHLRLPTWGPAPTRGGTR